ncbi:hypothetical protein [Vibrio phage D4]|nr:hypothetical protein vBVcaS_HC081 [Vibrio phage vB_VcaS_HC]UHD87278.1 hypothetical protein [Vibrio phage D4]WKV32778.1 hypothetical protein R21Y_17 [Vibrio phage vB_VhaS_R21Y]
MKHIKAIEILQTRYNAITNNLTNAVPEALKADMLRPLRLAMIALADPKFDAQHDNRLSLASAAQELHKAYALMSQERRLTINDREAHYDINDPIHAQGYMFLTSHIIQLNNDMVNLESAIRTLYKWDEDRGLDQE